MINLRYHVVTLVAVFLALAVGVVLGAGPLQSRISAASEGTDLAERAAGLEEQLATLEGSAVQQEAFIAGIAKEILPGSLSGKKVTLVALPGASEEDTAGIADMLALAGATVRGTVELTENWTSTAQREYRGTLSTPVSSHLAQSAGAATADDVLAQALLEVLTITGPEVDLVRQILSDQQVPLVASDSIPDEVADTLVLVGPRLPALTADDDSQSGAGVQMDASLTALAAAASKAPEGAAAVGIADGPSDFISLLRDGAVPIATVDQGGTTMAWLNTALALQSGSKGAYGQQAGAESAVAPLVNSR